MDKVEVIATIISPGWFIETFWDNSWQQQTHLLDNYPGQHEGYRNRARAKACTILKLHQEGILPSRDFMAIFIEGISEVPILDSSEPPVDHYAYAQGLTKADEIEKVLENHEETL